MLAAFYQTGTKAKVMLFQAGASGLVLGPDAYTTDVDYDLSRASIAAADTNEDGRDDLVSLYTDADGSAKVHVFDPAASFAPVNGWNVWLKYQVSWAMPEQLPEPPVPGHPPLSRWRVIVTLTPTSW